jgi:hypothetical protein
MHNRHRLALLAAAAALARSAWIGSALAGHEFPVYPSFYPHEIRIVATSPDAAGDALLHARLHAYLGATPLFAAAPSPDTLRPIESLGALVVVRIDPRSAMAASTDSACAAVHAVAAAIVAHPQPGFEANPFPVTPRDGDYLYYADLAEAAAARLHAADPAPPRALRVHATGALAERLVPAAWRHAGADADVEVAEVDAADLVARAGFAQNGWTTPPWLRAAWYRSALLLEPALGDAALRAGVDAAIARLEAGRYADAAERVRLERDVVATLAGDCRAMVAGYTLRREYVNVDYSAGVENIGFDSLTGLASPIFLRTVKLKDFPWNGWLNLGIDAKPGAAWNPIAGFDDRFGRALWYALGDSALIPNPNGSGWMLNRISDVR